MNNTNDKKIESMTNYAVEKYGKDFSVKYFQEAKDSSYTNILTLSDGVHLFNVYQSGDSKEITDDYARVIIDKKFSDHLSQSDVLSDDSMEFYSRIMLTSDMVLDYEFASTNNIDLILQQCDIQKIILVIRISDAIEQHKDELFAIYEDILAFEPKYIDLEVISSKEESDELKKALTNLTAYYDSDWNKYSEIKAFLSITEKDIQSAEMLVREVK